MENTNTSGKNVLRPRARIIKTIGEELISSDSVAILELIKNSYDADASTVEIAFEGDIKNGNGRIVIKDNGSGMDLETLQKGWMEPATILKKSGKKSVSGRRVLGEKGVGRFASAKLSKKLNIVTKSLGNSEIAAYFNWTDFNDDDKYLDEITCTWEKSDRSLIENHGTIIYLEELNSNWNLDKLQELRNSLSRIINPISPVNNFEISLSMPEEFSKLSGGVKYPEFFDKPDYRVSGFVNAEGEATITYSSLISSEEKFNESIQMKNIRPPTSGEFNFEFRVWDRDIETLRNLASKVGSTLKDIRKDLDEVAGITIYRDGFRVLPYGDKKNDWLRLDLRRVQNPTMRLSNNQIVGYVSISMDKNPILRDQSNREGLIDSRAFEDLKEAIIQILSKLESRRYEERRRDDVEEVVKQNIFSGISIAPVIEMVQRKIPNDSEATLVLIQTDEKIKESIKKVQEILSRYRRLSTLGLLIDSVLHDGNTFISRTSNELLILEKEMKENKLNAEGMKKHLDLINKERDALLNLFRRLEPFSGRKPKFKKEMAIEESIRNVFELFASEIKRLKIKTKIPQTNTIVRINDQDIQTIILNLLQNSLYWLEKEKKDTEKKIEVDIYQEGSDLVILFSDNGPGVNDKDIPFIFDPYFTTKPDGIGLGLTIAGELMAEYGGILELVKTHTLEGACFRLKFKLEDGRNKNIDG